jgi:hypothetical protein
MSAQRWSRLVVVLVLCATASACVVRPLGWGHRHGGNHYSERGNERPGGGGEQHDRRYRRP